MKIGERITRRREELGYSVDDLAAKIGKNRSTVYRYENDEIENFPVSALSSIAVALGVSPAWLMGYEDKVSSQPEENKLFPDNFLTMFGERKTKDAELTPSEQSLLTVYRTLNPQGQGEVNKYADYCATKPEYQKDTRSKAE